eukprot:scaffold331320_cov55-Attheya_sp.AAC.1
MEEDGTSIETPVQRSLKRQRTDDSTSSMRAIVSELSVSGNGGTGEDREIVMEEDRCVSVSTTTNPEIQHEAPSLVGKRLKALRLEAIFHPKFENETQSHQGVREKMLQRVEHGAGYLETTLKHSGSLLLWSGGQSYYSKNSMDNRFTRAGEMLLRQHFCRAWTNHHDSSIDMYDACSDFVRKNSLTISMEVVTSVLGDHGSVPHRDFIILTAIADRNTGRFYSTAQVIALAQKFRLPHNDAWLFTSPKSARALFAFYDQHREVGLANTSTLGALHQAADTRICSLYPHDIFQGRILEGIVIRYVPHKASSNKDVPPLEELATESCRILELIPPEMPPCFENVEKMENTLPVFTTNIRTLYKTHGDTQHFEDALGEILCKSDGNNRIVYQSLKCTSQRKSSDETSIPIMVQHLLEGEQDLDVETRRIARLIQSLGHLDIPVRYGLRYEVSSSTQASRWLCMIHVLNDSSFPKYYKAIDPKSDMLLYRGFCIQLLLEGGPVFSCISEKGESLGAAFDTNTEVYVNEEEEPLMLKMKFLPYMVRTFGCRNGLRTLSQKGPDAFNRYTYGMLRKWQVSQTAMEKWYMFFQAWGIHAYSILQRQNCDDKVSKSSIVEGSADNLLPLTEKNYLAFLDPFMELFESGAIPDTVQNNAGVNQPKSSPFRGLVVIVAQEKSISDKVAEDVAKGLGGCRTLSDINEISEEDMTISMLPIGGGLVCSAIIEDGVGRLRKLCKIYKENIVIIMCDCEESNMVIKQLPPNVLKKRMGVAKAWKSCNCYEISQLSLTALESKSELDIIIARFAKASKPDDRPGLLVFFPGIPGCGKSTVCDETITQSLVNHLANLQGSLDSADTHERPRSVMLRVGDKVKEKYWPMVRRERLQQGSSIYIADKNAPPVIWSTVGDICHTSRGMAVPVLPDDAALCTTEIRGIHDFAGNLKSDKCLVYPFSLHYLAVCIARVMQRSPNTHVGRLDPSEPKACMIVVKFYAFYMSYTAGTLEVGLKEAMQNAGAVHSTPLIRLPFFKQHQLPDLPEDLKDALEDALRLQNALDKPGGSTPSEKTLKAEVLVQMEARLRAVFRLHDEMLLSLTESRERSQEAFINQVVKHATSLESSSFKEMQNEVEDTPVPIKIVSIDISPSTISALLDKYASEIDDVGYFLKKNGYTPSIASLSKASADSTIKQPPEFVSKPHITMGHYSQLSQSEMIDRFQLLEGRNVRVTVTGLFFSGKAAALSVILDSKTMGGEQINVPIPENKFPHITIWFSNGASAVESNELPQLVDQGEATRIEFVEPDTISGVVRFWRTS